VYRKHAQITVAADQGDLGNVEALFEKPADRLVPQIMKPQVLQPSTLR
jgi:hypothetical protein